MASYTMSKDDVDLFVKNKKVFNIMNDIGLRVTLTRYKTDLHVITITKFSEFCFKFFKDNIDDSDFYSALMQIINTYFDEKFRQLLNIKEIVGYYFALKSEFNYLGVSLNKSTKISIRRKVNLKDYTKNFIKHITSSYEDKIHASIINTLNTKVDYSIDYVNSGTKITPVLSGTLQRIYITRDEYETAEGLLISLNIPKYEIRKIRKMVELLKDTKQTFRDILNRYGIRYNVDELYSAKARINHETMKDYYESIVRILVDQLSHKDFKKIRTHTSNDDSEEEPYDYPSYRLEDVLMNNFNIRENVNEYAHTVRGYFDGIDEEQLMNSNINVIIDVLRNVIDNIPFDAPDNEVVPEVDNIFQNLNINNVKHILDYRNIANNDGASNIKDIHQVSLDVYKHLISCASKEFLLGSFTNKITSEVYNEFLTSLHPDTHKQISDMIKENPILPLKDNEKIHLRFIVYLVIDFVYMQPEGKRKDMLDVIETCLNECVDSCNTGIFNRLMITMYPFIQDESIYMSIDTEIGDSLGHKIRRLAETHEDLEDIITNNNVTKMKELLYEKYLDGIIDEYTEEYKDISDKDTITRIVEDTIKKY